MPTTPVPSSKLVALDTLASLVYHQYPPTLFLIEFLWRRDEGSESRCV